MFTIEDVEYITIINKSKFIANLISVDNIDEVNKYLDMIKSKYKDATHHCYGYIIDNIKRFNDDNEPSGTAGMPILDCLEKNNLNHVLCIVTRYFGGIKLGAGGLVRAYSNSVSNAINNTNKLELINGYEIKITFDYTNEKDINKLLVNYNIIDKIYGENITYIVQVDNNIIDKIKNIVNLEIMKEIVIKKKI